MINIIKNNKIKILIFGIFMFLCIIICMNYTKAYTIDNEGNLVSNNILDYNNYYNSNTEYSVEGYNNSLRIEVDNPNNHIAFFTIASLEVEANKTYYIKKFKIRGNDNIVNIYTFFVEMDNERYYQSFTPTTNQTVDFVIRLETDVTEGEYVTQIYIGTEDVQSYEPMGIWYSQENLEIINPWIDNIDYVIYERQTPIDLNNETAPYYISPDNIAYNLLLNANGYTNETYYEYPMYLEIRFKRPVYMSNYKYTISFNNNGPNGEQETYIEFTNTNGPNYVYNFIYEALDYEFQLPTNMYVDTITIKWYNTTNKHCWPEGMTLNDFYLGWSQGVQQGTREGYRNGYDEGYNTGIQSGEQVGYNNGYAQGFEEGAHNSNTLYGMVIRSS